MKYCHIIDWARGEKKYQLAVEDRDVAVELMRLLMSDDSVTTCELTITRR